MIPYVGVYAFGSSSRFHSFALAETIFQQPTEFGFLRVSAGNVLGQVGPAIMVFLGARQLLEL